MKDNAIPGVMAQPINSWAEFKKVLRQLKDPKVQEKFSTIIVDTADIAYGYCENYICSNTKRPDGAYGFDAIGDIPFGKGFTMAGKEFDEALRLITQLNYGLVLISHSTDKTFKDESGQEYNQIVPTLNNKARNICSRLCDIIGYSRIVQLESGDYQTRLFLRGTPRYVAGSRFKYTPDSIEFTYDNLVGAIADAIDKQAEASGNAALFTEERSNLYLKAPDLDFDELMEEFQKIIVSLTEKYDEEEFESKISEKITQIIERYLGKGMKVTNCSRDQVEALSLIVDELKEL